MTAIFSMIARLFCPLARRLNELVVIKYHQQAISVLEYKQIAGLIQIALYLLVAKNTL
jgi:hypothetical protein